MTWFMVSAAVIPLIPVANFLLWAWPLAKNYAAARTIGVPIRITPFSPEGTTPVLKRATQFSRPIWVNDVLAVFGPNISTVEGQSWKTQQRVAAQCFNEANDEIGWTPISLGVEDVGTLTLNVLARPGFGKSFKFRGQNEKLAEEAQSMSYRESLSTILENYIVILALGPKTLQSKLRTVNKAVVSFQTHRTTIYKEQKLAFAAGEEESD